MASNGGVWNGVVQSAKRGFAFDSAVKDGLVVADGAAGVGAAGGGVSFFAQESVMRAARARRRAVCFISIDSL